MTFRVIGNVTGVSIVPEEEWLRVWLLQRLELQPKGSPSLTYFAGKYRMYREYAEQCPGTPVSGVEFHRLLREWYPELQHETLHGQDVILGARFYADCIGGNLVFGYVPPKPVDTGLLVRKEVATVQGTSRKGPRSRR